MKTKSSPVLYRAQGHRSTLMGSHAKQESHRPSDSSSRNLCCILSLATCNSFSLGAFSLILGVAGSFSSFYSQLKCQEDFPGHRIWHSPPRHTHLILQPSLHILKHSSQSVNIYFLLDVLLTPFFPKRMEVPWENHVSLVYCCIPSTEHNTRHVTTRHIRSDGRNYTWSPGRHSIEATRRMVNWTFKAQTVFQTSDTESSSDIHSFNKHSSSTTAKYHSKQNSPCVHRTQLLVDAKRSIAKRTKMMPGGYENCEKNKVRERQQGMLGARHRNFYLRWMEKPLVKGASENTWWKRGSKPHGDLGRLVGLCLACSTKPVWLEQNELGGSRRWAQRWEGASRATVKALALGSHQGAVIRKVTWFDLQF